MVLTNEEWSELQQLKDRELEVWSQLSKWVVDRCNTYDTYYKGDSNEQETKYQCKTTSP